MTRKKLLAVALVCMASGFSCAPVTQNQAPPAQERVAPAQQEGVPPAEGRGPPAQGLAACQGDIKKLCPQIKPGGGRIIACLGQHKAELTPSCKTTVDQSKGNIRGRAPR